MTAVPTTDLLVTLLGGTEGRDKLLKAAGGLARVACHFTGKKEHEALFKSVSTGRSLMRLLSWISNIQKMAPIVAKGGPTNIDWATFLRILLDAGFCVCDNIVYFGTPGLLSVNVPKTVLTGIRFMCLGFLVAVLLDVWYLLSLPADKPQERAKRQGMLIRNLCDFVASLNGSLWVPRMQLNHLHLGLLAFASGAVASSENWAALPKTKADDAKKKSSVA